MLFNGNGKFFLGFTVGFGTGLIARDAFPYISRLVKPLSKQTIKLGITSLEKTRESLSRFGEILEDITEEVKFELKSRGLGKSGKTRPVTPKKKRTARESAPTIEVEQRRTA
jgi:hypothetical protein